MKNKRIISLGLLIICLFSFIYIQPILASTWSNYSVEQGDDLFESYPYDFSVLYYDENNYSKQFTQAKLETQHAIYTDISTNNSIMDLTNYYNYYPDDLTINQGINNSAGTLNSLDDDYYNITSANLNQTIPESSNFNLINGSIVSTGDLENIDDSYYTFNNSISYVEVPGLYPATYTFTDDADGNDPADWDILETGTADVQVISSIGDHNKVVQCYDPDSSNPAGIEQTSLSQDYGTIEFWFRFDKITGSTFYYFYLYNSGTIVIMIRWNSLLSVFQYLSAGYHTIPNQSSISIDTWYHMRIDFELTAGNYLGLSQYKHRISIDGSDSGSLDVNSNDPQITKIQLRTDNSYNGYTMYLDAIGYSWDINYEIGDNLDDLVPQYDLNFTATFNSVDTSNYFAYSFKTNISVNVNVSFYNFNTDIFDLYETDISYTSFSMLEFIDFNSSYYNATNYVKFKIEAYNITEFELQLEVLKLIIIPSILNISAIVDLEDLTNLLELQVSAYYYTSISQELNFSIYCFDNSSWVLINSSINYSGFYESLFIYNSSNILDFFNSTQIKLQFYAINNTNQFDFYLDFIQTKIYTKLELLYSLSFNIKGLYKYRFHIYDELWISTNWIYFEVVEKQNNIKMISESSKLTEWEFLSQDYTTIEVYEEDDFSNWFLNVSDNDLEIINDETISNDAMTYANLGSQKYGGQTSARAGYFYNDNGFMYIFLENSIRYLTSNMTNQNTLTFYVFERFYPVDYAVNLTGSFDESTICWNNQPIVSTSVSGIFNVPNGWYTINLTTYIDDYYVITGYNQDPGITNEYFGIYTSEYYQSSKRPYFTNYYSKLYRTTNYIYVQTDETETLNLQSPNNLNLNLQTGDKIEITFNTTSTNKIDLNLLNNNIEQTSYTISQQDNQNFNDRTITLTLDSNYTIDQLEFSGIFEDTKNLFVKDVKVYTIESFDVSETYSVNPYGSQSIFINFPQDISVYVYEDYIQVESFNLTTSQDLTTLVYEKADSQINYIFLYDSNNNYLNFNDFIIYTNYTLQEYQYLDKRLSGNEFYTDVGSSIDFKVYDSFNNLIYSDTKNSQTFIDIDLPVFSFKIKNEASKNISYTLTNNATSEFKSGKMFSQELIEFNIATGIYILNYTNSENNQDYSELINLNDNTLFTIESTYFEIYFALFNYDGLGLDPNLFRFYINNERKDFGFNTMIQDVNNLKVLDYFNATLKNVDVNLKPYTEYNLAVSVYTMILNNKFNRTVRLEIERAGSDITFIATIRELDSVPYRFLSGIEYDISIYEIDNNTLLYHEDRLLDDPIEIVDFGFYQQEIPSNPVPEFLNIMTQWGIILFFTFVLLIFAFIAWTRLKKEQYKTEIREKGQSVMLKKGSNQPYY